MEAKQNKNILKRKNHKKRTLNLIKIFLVITMKVAEALDELQDPYISITKSCGKNYPIWIEIKS